MKFTKDWLKDHLKTNKTEAQIIEKLNNTGLEVEKVEEIIFIDHKVKRGESLWLIARKYGVRVKDIVSINKRFEVYYGYTIPNFTYYCCW